MESCASGHCCSRLTAPHLEHLSVVDVPKRIARPDITAELRRLLFLERLLTQWTAAENDATRQYGMQRKLAPLV